MRGSPRHLFIILLLGCVVSLLAACSGLPGGNMSLSLLGGGAEEPPPEKKPEDYYVQRVVGLRKEARASPGSARIENELKREEETAATHYLTQGMAALNQRQYEDALRLFELGMLAQPGNSALGEARVQALRGRELERLYADAMRAKSVGNIEMAESLLQKAEGLDRGNPKLQLALREIDALQTRQEQRYVIKAMESSAPIELNFQATKLTDALKLISQPHSINFIYDPDVESAEVNVSAKRVSFAQAFHLLLQSGDCFYKVIGPNSILIAPNKPDKKDKYGDFYTKTFHLRTIKAERMAEILTGSMDLKAVVPNKTLNTVQVRDTRETLKIVERVISAQDRMPAEIMLDVEILEINRSKSEQLGIDYGSQISTAIPQFTVTDALDNLSTKVIGNGLVSIPTLTLRYFKNDVDARVLAKPRIRTTDGEPAKIHIGDRVPLRSSTIQDATGQTRTTFEYRDIGIRLEVLPTYHLDNTISVALKLEVSSLGQNLGTTSEPAFSIGTRNVDTSMILREGETAVLGGLIRDEERRRLNKVPGLGDIGGVVGRLFAVNDDEDQRTDILLTITPQVLRHQSLPRMGDTDFYSGSKGVFSTQNSYDYLQQQQPSEEPPRYRLSPDRGDQQVAVRDVKPRDRRPGNSGGAAPVKPAALTLQAGGSPPRLGFGTEHYSVAEGEVVEIRVTGQNLREASQMQTRILFNPDKLSLHASSATPGSEVIQSDTSRPGVLDLVIKNAPQSEDVVIATVALRGKAKGLSYLLLNAASMPKGKDGEAINVELGSSKIEIR